MLYDVDRDCFVKVAPYDLCNGDMFTLPPTLVLLPRCVGARSGRRRPLCDGLHRPRMAQPLSHIYNWTHFNRSKEHTRWPKKTRGGRKSGSTALSRNGALGAMVLATCTTFLATSGSLGRTPGIRQSGYSLYCFLWQRQTKANGCVTAAVTKLGVWIYIYI